MSKNYFTELAEIDCSKHVEKKGRFSYLSWSWAVDQLLKKHPSATWETIRFDGLPYQNTPIGFFVEVAVTVDKVTRSQIHPVLDNQNRPIAKPTTFQINTSIQRALVKAIALHGLGLYIYSGEDLPDVAAEAITPADAKKMHDLIAIKDIDAEAFTEWMKDKHGFASVESITTDKYEFLFNTVSNRKDKEQVA